MGELISKYSKFIRWSLMILIISSTLILFYDNWILKTNNWIIFFISFVLFFSLLLLRKYFGKYLFNDKMYKKYGENIRFDYQSFLYLISGVFCLIQMQQQIKNNEIFQWALLISIQTFLLAIIKTDIHYISITKKHIVKNNWTFISLIDITSLQQYKDCLVIRTKNRKMQVDFDKLKDQKDLFLTEIEKLDVEIKKMEE